jgi:hypothetical protein
LLPALAAGVLATLVINRPGGPGDRDVALVELRATLTVNSPIRLLGAT